MQKRIAGSILITLAILMALMPLAKATTQHYWWDSIYFVSIATAILWLFYWGYVSKFKPEASGEVVSKE